MTEFNPQEPSDNQPQAIVPITEIQEPIFSLSAEQKKLIEQFTVSYMRKNKIPFTSNGVTSATSVLLEDALPRGMRTMGISELGTKDNLVDIIKKGVSEREKLTSRAKNIHFEYRNRLEKEGNARLGPFALSRHSLLGLIPELKHSQTRKSLAHSQQVTEWVNDRSNMLPRIAEAILQALPKEQFPEANIDQFPSPDDQAKIIRNVMVSLAFRGNPNPIISTNEIHEFTQKQAPQNTEAFEAFCDTVITRTGLESKRTRAYLTDLYQQTLDEIGRKGNMPNVGSHQIIDMIYVRFSNHLLLLHPALEERRLIIDLKDHTPDSYSLWGSDFSTEIENYRVPKPEILLRALRLVNAQGMNGNRFKDALQTWRDYKREVDTKTYRMKQINLEIEKLKNTAQNLTPDTVTTGAVNLALGTSREFAGEFHIVEGRRNHFGKIIRRLDREYEKVHGYLSEVKRENGGQFPAKIIQIYTDEQITRRLKSRADSYRENLWRVELNASDLFNKDLLASIVRSSETRPKNNFHETNSSTIEEILENLKREQQRAIDYPHNIIPSTTITVGDVFTHIQGVIEELVATESYLKATAKKPSDAKSLDPHDRRKLREYSDFMNMHGAMLQGTDSTRMGVPRQFYLYTLGKRIHSLQQILTARAKSNDPKINIFTPQEMTAKEAENAMRIQEIQHPEITTLEEQSLIGRHLDQLLPLKQTLYSLEHLTFPRTFQGKEDFASWITQWSSKTLPGGKKKSPHSPYREQHIHTLNQFIKAFDNPLFPKEEEMIGLPTRNLLTALTKRISYIEAVYRFPDSNRRTEELLQLAKEKALIDTKKQIENDIKKLQADLDRWESRNPTQKFLDQMQRLKLALPIA